jgi:hypothetical protein
MLLVGKPEVKRQLGRPRHRWMYSASHSRVAPENVGLQKEQKCNTFACHTCNDVRLCFVNSQKGSWPLALSVSREERCEVLACHQTVQQTSSGNS